jgi:uncharacterized protein YcaQ
MRQLSIHAARRIALAAQGFGNPRPGGRIDVRHFRRVIRHIGTIQLDSVNVTVRAHYMPVFSRLGPYSREAFDDYLNHSGEMVEYWAHAASVLPTERLPLFGFRMDGVPSWKQIRAIEEEHPGYVDEVLREVAESGPLVVSGLNDAGERTGPWWGYGRGKLVLEWHFAAGRLVAHRAGNFNRIYDVPERRIPAAIREAGRPDRATAYRELLGLAAASLGVATAADLADYYRLRIGLVRPLLEEMVAAGELAPIAVEGWAQPAFLTPGAVRPRRIGAAALVSPFDSLIWYRERTERLFGMRYRIEIYVPEVQREYGYYVYPFLLGEDLVARVDLKADRKAGMLHVKGAYLEAGQDADRVAPVLGKELRTMAEWLGLDAVRIHRKGDLANALEDAR